MTNEEQNDAGEEFHEAGLEQDHATNLDRAVDTLAALLRDFGANAFDLPDRSAQTLVRFCEQWANHVLFASPPPDDPSSSEKGSGGRRDWSGLRTFFAEHRRSESHYVLTALAGMRQILWACVNEMRQSVLGNTHADAWMQEQMDHLEQIVQTADPSELRREVLSVVTSVNRLLEQQQEMNRMRMEAMHDHIRQLDSLLAQARKESSLDALTPGFKVMSRWTGLLVLSCVLRTPSRRFSPLSRL